MAARGCVSSVPPVSAPDDSGLICVWISSAFRTLMHVDTPSARTYHVVDCCKFVSTGMEANMRDVRWGDGAMSKSEAARFMGLSASTINTLVKSGDLATSKVGGRVVLSRADCIDLLSVGTEKGPDDRLPEMAINAIESLGGRVGLVRVRDIGRALRSTPRASLEAVLAHLTADGVLEHAKVDRHQGKGQTTDAYRIREK